MPDELARWGDFYLITGGAAAALTGLQFVVQTLLATDLQRLIDTSDVEGGIQTFGTPTVVHFAVAMIASAAMCAPWPGTVSLGIVLLLGGGGAFGYSVVVIRRALRQRVYRTTVDDWVWHIVLPTVAYGAMIAASFELQRATTAGGFFVAGAVALLLCAGVHNAWDTVTYLTIMAFSDKRGGEPATPRSPAGDSAARGAGSAGGTGGTGGAGDTGTMRDAPPTPDADLVIRAAHIGDLPAMGRLGREMVRAHHEFDARRFIPVTPETEAGYAGFLGTQLDRDKVVLRVAARAGDVIGYAYAGLEGYDWMALRGPCGALYDVVVDPAHRGRGVGRALLDAAVRELSALGARQFVLATAERNTVAQRLFERAGFRRTMAEMTRDIDPATAPRAD